MSRFAPASAHAAPPPPPLPISCHTAGKIKITTAKTQIPSDECSWALDYPDLQKGCFLSRVCQYARPKRCQYYDISSILQVGPTCGLTALSMILNGKPSVADLYADATIQSYTIMGEMFSARYLYELTQKHLHSPLNCQFYEGVLNCEHIKEQLVNGCCLLVPYDADVNHAPCQKSGHRAHWALVVGYLIEEPSGEFHVLARHGKTSNLAVWSLAALSESNTNLVEFAQPKGYPDCTFLLPPGGLDGPLGLSQRCVLVEGLKQTVINPIVK